EVWGFTPTVVWEARREPVDDLLFRPPEERGRRAIPVLDPSLGVERDDGKGGGVDEHPEPLARPPERLLRAPLLIEEPRVLQSGGRLVGEGLQERHFLVEERAIDAVSDAEHADGRSLDAQGHG